MGVETTFCARSAAVGSLGAGVVAPTMRTAIREKPAKKLRGWARPWRNRTVMRTPWAATPTRFLDSHCFDIRRSSLKRFEPCGDRTRPPVQPATLLRWDLWRRGGEGRLAVDRS